MKNVLIDGIEYVPKAQPLFTTNGDNLPIYDKHEFWFIWDDTPDAITRAIASKNSSNGTHTGTTIYFGNKSNAEAYLKVKQQEKDPIKVAIDKYCLTGIENKLVVTST